MKTAALILALVLMSSGDAHATAPEWKIDYKASKLGFLGTQGNQSFDGQFQKFTATVLFDMDHPENGVITADIDMTSATTGAAERDSQLPTADWFNTAKFASAHFASTAIRATSNIQAGGRCFEAVGNLTIKGITKSITLPFCLVPQGDHYLVSGKTHIMRNDFAVGQGDWDNESQVKFTVDVVVDLVARQ